MSPHQPPKPETTLAILLGASNWPHYAEFQASPSFRKSAEDFRDYLLGEKGFGLPPENLCYLFDTSQSPLEIIQEISEFLHQRLNQSPNQEQLPQDLIVYYVGHGGFRDSTNEYYLAIQATRRPDLYISSIPIQSLAKAIKEEARYMRRYIILDSCFSAAAYNSFQAAPLEVAYQKTTEVLPEMGTALLCSSGPRVPSRAPPGLVHTMFTDALIEVLKLGYKNGPKSFSIQDLHNLICNQLRNRFEDDAVRPEVHAPEQRHGDISEVPLFPNPARRGEKEDIAAANNVSKALGMARETPESWNRKGDNLLCQKNYDKAIKAYNKAIELDPNFAKPWSGKGDALLSQKKYNEAIQIYDKAIELDPKFANAWSGKGDALCWQKKYDESVKTYNKAITLDPKFAKAWSGKGDALCCQKRYDEAIQIYDKTIELDPKFAKAWSGKGDALCWQKKYDEAIKAYNKAIELDPNYAWPWSGKGVALYWQKKYDEAINAHDRAIELDPKFAWPWLGKGNVLYEQKKYDKAIRVYDVAIELDTNFVWPWNNKGNILCEQKKYDEAIKAYTKAIELDPSIAEPWLGKGHAWKGKGDEALEKRDRTKWNELHKFSPSPLSFIQEKDHEFIQAYDKAMRDYDKAIMLDPNIAEPWNGKGNVLYAQKKYDEAIKAYDKAIDLDPNYAWPWNNKGNILCDKKKYDEAIKAYTKAIELDPNIADPWRGKGNALKGLGRYSDAEAAFQKALRIEMAIGIVPISFKQLKPKKWLNY